MEVSDEVDDDNDSENDVDDEPGPSSKIKKKSKKSNKPKVAGPKVKATEYKDYKDFGDEVHPTNLVYYFRRLHPNVSDIEY